MYLESKLVQLNSNPSYIELIENKTPKEAETLIVACKDKHAPVEFLKFYFDEKPNWVNMYESHTNNTLLHCAIQNDHNEEVILYLAEKINPFAANTKFRGWIHDACNYPITLDLFKKMIELSERTRKLLDDKNITSIITQSLLYAEKEEMSLNPDKIKYLLSKTKELILIDLSYLFQDTINYEKIVNLELFKLLFEYFSNSFVHSIYRGCVNNYKTQETIITYLNTCDENNHTVLVDFINNKNIKVENIIFLLDIICEEKTNGNVIENKNIIIEIFKNCQLYCSKERIEELLRVYNKKNGTFETKLSLTLFDNASHVSQISSEEPEKTNIIEINTHNVIEQNKLEITKQFVNNLKANFFQQVNNSPSTPVVSSKEQQVNTCRIN